ncbi:hypothetical protein ABFX02_02G125900 [Erythranthe guttata]
MGNPNAAKPSDQTPATTHFSHPHPLQLVDPQTLTQFSHCSACKLDAAAAAAVYTCRPCNFILHQKCYQMPQKMNHPYDKTHALVLQPKPVYAEGVFRCDACGNEGGGFSYTCGPCGVDLHTTCAFLAAELPHHCHHHPLSLTYSAPYEGNTFSCDVCKMITSQTWMYRCNGCEFDVHVTCVAKVIPPPRPLIQQAPRPMITARSVIPPPPQNPQNMGSYNNMPQHHQHVPIGQPHNQQFVGTGTPYLAAGMPIQNGAPPQHGNFNQPGNVAAGRPANGGGIGGRVAVATTRAFVDGMVQAAGGAVIQELLGFGGGGDGGGGLFQLDVLGIGGGGGGLFDGGGDCGGGGEL